MQNKRHGHGTIHYGEKTFLDYDLTLESIVSNAERGLKRFMCLMCKPMETGTKAAGEKGKRAGEESFATLTKARFMKGFGWAEMQDVELCLTLEEVTRQR